MTNHLDNTAKRTLALEHLCGVPDLQSSWGVSYSNIVYTLKKVADTNNLVNYYREHSKTRNAAHLYLVFRGIDVPDAALVDKRDDAARTAYKKVEEEVIVPLIGLAVSHAQLEPFLNPRDGYERLLSEFFYHRGEHSRFYSTVEQVLQAFFPEDFTAKEAQKALEGRLIHAVRDGALCMTDEKRHLILQAIESANADSKQIIYSRYGLDDGVQRTHRVVAQRYQFSRARSGQVIKHAFERLSPSSIAMLELAGFSTSDDLGKYGAKVASEAKVADLREEVYRQMRITVMRELASNPEVRKQIVTGNVGEYDPEILNIPLSKLDLSVRARNALNNAHILTVGDITGHSERELRKYRYVANKVVNEVKALMVSLGVALRPDIPTQITE
jgi:hypothetical protein